MRWPAAVALVLLGGLSAVALGAKAEGNPSGLPGRREAEFVSDETGIEPLALLRLARGLDLDVFDERHQLGA